MTLLDFFRELIPSGDYDLSLLYAVLAGALALVVVDAILSFILGSIGGLGHG